MNELKVSGRNRRRRVSVGFSIAAGGVALASAAWACSPEPPPSNTQLSSCSKPASSTTPCQPVLGTPAFPNANSVKGPAGSRVVAFTQGSSQDKAGQPFDLMFTSKPQIAAGVACGAAGSAKIAGPVSAGAFTPWAIPSASGVVPTNAPLGGGQLCFTRSGTAGAPVNPGTTPPALFKVVV